MTTKFGWASMGHFFAAVAHDIHVADLWVKKQAPAVLKEVDVAAGIVSFDPQLAPLAQLIDRAAHSLLGDAIAVASTADSAAAANGVNITLDQATLAALKQLGADMLATTKQSVPSGLAP
jgi:hypothetical protein